MTNPIDILAITGTPLVRLLKRVTLEVRIVASARRQMRRSGYRIDSKRLRQLIFAPAFSARLAKSRSSDDSLVDDLADVIRSPSRGDREVGLVLRGVLAGAVRARLSGSSPSSEFKDDRDEARTAEIVRAVETTSNDEALFEHRLTAMHPLRAQDFRDLRQEWAGAAKFLGAISATKDRPGLLKRWSSYPPTYLDDAPPSVFGILADLAADLPASSDATQLFEAFIQGGLERGLAPKGYWAVRLLSAKRNYGLEEAIDFLADVRGYPLVEATLHPDGTAAAIATLEGWAPVAVHEDLQRSLLLAEYYLRSLKVDEAIALGQSTYERFQSTTAAMHAARALMTRHMVDASVVNRNDLSSALLLAVRARADRIRWGVDSGPALALEIRVRRSLSDYQGAFDLVSSAAEAPTSQSELRHPEVIAETAMLHADRGDVEIAQRLLATAPESRRPHIAALIAEREDRDEDAVEKWAEAIEATDDLGEQADLALQLAFHGVRSPIIDALKVDNAAVARELELTASLFGHEPGALEQFRGFANANLRGALFLCLYFKGEGDDAAAATIAREGAAKWGDPDLWLESARFHGRQEKYAEAISGVQAALLASSEDWGGKRIAYRLLVEFHSASGDWKEALAASATVAAAEPDNPSAAWALVICQIHVNDLDGALRSWQKYGAPEPRDETEVRAWIELLGEFGQTVGTSLDALSISNRFASDEQIRGALLGVLFFREKPGAGADDSEEEYDEAEVSEVDLDPETLAFREMLASYTRDFPDGAIRQVAVDAEDPLASLREQFSGSAGTPELDEQIERGVVPIGLAAELYGKSYLESLLARDQGPVFAGSMDINSEEAALATAHAKGAVIDLSALVTLGLLPESVRDLVSGHFANVRTLTEQHRDAMIGSRTVARDSGLSYQPARGDIPERFHKRTPEEVSERAALATAIEGSFARFVAVSHPRLTSLSLRAEKLDKPFLLGADLAIELDVPFWADDTALKEVMRGEGGTPFGTPELLNHLRGEGLIDPSLIDLAEATLITHGYSGVRFRTSVWELADAIASSPLGMINAVRYAGNDDADGRYQAALHLIDSRVAEPDHLGGFVFAVGQWLDSIASTEESASQNIVVLSRELLGKAWMSSSTLPYCVAAFRAISGKADATTLLLREIYRVFEAIADRANYEAAATVVFELVSRLDAREGLRVRAAVLARRFE